MMNTKNIKLALKVAQSKPKYRHPILHFLARKGHLSKWAKDKKRMVIMVGPPASGKGYFLERETGEVGKGLPESTQGLFTDDQIPEEKRGVEESDNHLRAIQYYESLDHYEELKKAHNKGEDEFKKAVEDMWYKTKDGDTRKMESFISYDDFPDNHYDFFSDKSKAFYKNMRSWHDDVDKVNSDTGKIKERFKDEARQRFEENVRDKLGEGKKDMLIIDSAGEDIDAQDFGGQIEAAKNAGYEVTVIMLDPEKEDTNLSNMSRGFIGGKRMVDEKDIDNFYEKYEKQLEGIKKAAPHNFLHYKKPPISDADRKKLKKSMEETPDGKPTFLKDPDSKIRSIEDLPKDQAKKVKGDVFGTLYAKDYELDKDSSFGATMKGLPKNPHYKDNTPKKKDEEKSNPANDEKWLHKKVKNPETGNDVLIKTLQNKPKKSKAHQYYQKLKKDREKELQKAASKIANRKFTIKKVATQYYREVKKMSGRMQKDMKDLGEKVTREHDQIDDYDLEMEVGRGPVLYFILKKGAGDTTAARHARDQIGKIVEKDLKGKLRGALKSKIRSFNRGSDLVLELEVVFPS